MVMDFGMLKMQTGTSSSSSQPSSKKDRICSTQLSVLEALDGSVFDLLRDVIFVVVRVVH